MPQLGPLEIAVVLLIALLVFGPNRLPELARQVGGALKELRKIQHNLRADLHEMMTDQSDEATAPPSLPPKGDPSAGDVTDIVEAASRDAGLPPTDVPTSGSGEDAGPADAPRSPPPDTD